MLIDNNDVISNMRQLLTSTHPAVPVAMYLFGLNFQIELLLKYMFWIYEWIKLQNFYPWVVSHLTVVQGWTYTSLLSSSGFWYPSLYYIYTQYLFTNGIYN